VRLRQPADAAALASRSAAHVLPPGTEVAAHVYGTPRAFGATHVTARVLTARNCREFPTVAHFDPLFVSAIEGATRRDLLCISPEFVEWLMGAPRGWTSVEPLDPAVAAARAKRQRPTRPRRRATLSLFSGCGAMDLALLPWWAPCVYCELDAGARRVLLARMADGSLPWGPITPDVRDVHAVDLPRRLEGIVAGFPCVDLSQAGARLGERGDRSVLVWEALRLCDETRCNFLFLENVNALRFRAAFWRPLLEAQAARGFEVEWVTLAASDVGSPQRRRRWFALAVRGRLVGRPLADPVSEATGGVSRDRGAPRAALRDARLSAIREQRGVRFNPPGRPPPERWMLPRSAYTAEVRGRLAMLGNAVVPLQVEYCSYALRVILRVEPKAAL